LAGGGWGAGGDGFHPDLCALLQYLGQLRLPLLSGLPALHQGSGGLRLQGLRHYHDDGRDFLGGYLFLRIGRFPTVCWARCCRRWAICSMPTGRWRAWDRRLCRGHRAGPAGAALGADARMLRLLLAIVYENIATGLAGRPSSPMSPAWCPSATPRSSMRCCPR
jgi:hypothetical protein